MTGVIEKASLESEGDLSPSENEEFEAGVNAPRLFDIDFERLSELGFYSPDRRTAQLSLELRAIKRRLMRRVGFLRSTGDRRLLRKSGRRRNLVMVTSTRPAEGKTFTSINLALSLAMEDEVEVLLVDADTSRPKIMSQFGLEAEAGLTDRLIDPALSIPGLSHKARHAPLTIFPQGRPADRTTDLFASTDAQRLFTELSVRRADRLVIIDAPPVLSSTDALMLARHVDEIVFVVESDATPEPAIASAIDELLDINPHVSLVLNRCLIGAGGAHYGSYEDYNPRGLRDGKSE